MRTRDALHALTGQRYEHGDGPLANVARELLHNFQIKETERLAAADERAAMAGQGPILAVLQRKLAEARAEDLFQDATPCVSRFEAFTAIKNARGRHPTDRGLRMAAAHFERLWHKDTMGVLAIGDVARIRAHYQQQFPRSVVAEVIDTEIPKVGFNTLPVHKLAPLAAQVVGNNDQERQLAYEAVVMANGLGTNKPEHRRAREFIRAMAEMAAEPAPLPSPYSQGGQQVAERVLQRMASYDDPILSHVGQALPGGGAPGGMGELPPVEQEVPHEETTEVIDQVESPITGEPLSIELGQAMPDGAPEGPGADGAPGAAPMEVQPGLVASLNYLGQLEQFDAPNEAIDGFDAPTGESTVQLEDPSAPGEMLDVTIAPAESAPEGGNVGTSGSPGAMPGMDNQAGLGKRPFAVYSMRGGVRHDKPLQRVRAFSMADVLRHVAKMLRDADGGLVIPREIRAAPGFEQSEAFVVLDDACGNYLYVTADVFEPADAVNGQPVVRHNLKLKQDQGLKVLIEDKELKQNVPGAASESEHPTSEKHDARKLTKERIVELCKQANLTAHEVEAKVLAGEEVRVGNVAVRMTEDADLVLFRGERGRVASLVDMDRVVSDFLVLAAHELAGGARTAASVPALGFQIRALFTVGCGRCNAVGEYLMPDQPEHIRCASCGWVTPLEAVAIQLEMRQATAFPGYVITSDVPGDVRTKKTNAKRMLQAIKQVAPYTDGATIRQGRLEVSVRNVGDAELNRIRKVLAEVFGAREITSQQMAPAGFGVQHQTMPMSPMQQPQPPAPTYQPPAQQQQPAMQPAQPGTGLQQQQMAQYGDPGQMPEVQPVHAALRLPSGPGIKHARIRYEDGHEAWIPVEAANDTMVRHMVASRMDGTTVVEVIDSLVHVYQAQMAAPPPPPAPAPAAPPPGGAAPAPAPAPGAGGQQMGLEPGGGGMAGAPENVEQASVDPQTEQLIRAALTHFRATGIPIDEATSKVQSSYKPLLERFGDKTSPARHLLGATILRIAKEIYEQPALVASGNRQRRADQPKGPQPKKINEQQDDWVDLPGAGKVLGPDSTSGGGFSDPKVNQQVDIIAIEPGTSATPTDLGQDSDARDPKRFDAPKPPSDGHVKFDGPGWGQSYSDTNLGTDTQTGDNPETAGWDGTSSGAYSNVRSK